jgi:polyhydroxyalkanoate synthesis repressor PhaR
MPQCGIFTSSPAVFAALRHNRGRARDGPAGDGVGLARLRKTGGDQPASESEETMIRLIKRYESRKLYDTEESRYVSLDEIAAWVREGQEIRVVDNATEADVTSQTLTQIILEEGRKGTSLLSSDLLHELVRMGERAVETGRERVQQGVDRLVQASVDRLGPLRRAREEMTQLRSQLEQLEGSLRALEAERGDDDGGLAGDRSEKTTTDRAERPGARREKSR